MGRWAAIMLAVLATGCVSENSVPGETCDRAETCGPIGDAICVDGSCHIYDDNSGYGQTVVNLSFDRDMPYQVSASVYIYILHNRMADGTALDCDRILSGDVVPQDATANSLVVNPRYLELHWTAGGTFFPNNLIQFIRPAEFIVAVVEGYQFLQGEGDLTAIGCNDEETIFKDQTVEFTIQLNTP